MDFKLVSKFKPTGDQPQAIDELVQGLSDGLRAQVLKGVTGSGKTFTMANIIERVQRPTLVLAHNKTLAAQLCNEFKEFFPHNRVEYFVSYYDYYQPEAYIPTSDTYIEKDLAINDDIDKLRHSATCSLQERRDTIVVSSVSCIYGLGAPEQYYRQAISLRTGEEFGRDNLIRRLIAINYKRNDMETDRTTFRVRGDTVDIYPSNSSETGIRVEFFGDEIDCVAEFNVVTNEKTRELSHAAIFPASHYAVERDTIKRATEAIASDMEERVKFFETQGKLIEAQRIKERVRYDLEMMNELGYCSGIENYSRYFDGRNPGEPPYTLLDYFPKDYIMFIDESHMTVPQVRAMYAGDRARKSNLVDFGFRLPAAFDNRPLKFDEFDCRTAQTIYVSATPAPYELSLSGGRFTTQIIRPTGLVDPPVSVRPIKGQIDDLLSEIKEVTERDGRILVTTLTKRMAENLTNYLTEQGVKTRYLHSDIDTMERIAIINGLRSGQFDVLVGINLLREGLDIPEVQLVAILDADKEGFLRSDTSLIQTIGRAARNSESRVIMYADVMTGSMKRAIDETEARRKVQIAYNEKHCIVPKTIIKDIKNRIDISAARSKETEVDDIPKEIERLRALMRAASTNLDFESAIHMRDRIAELSSLQKKMNALDKVSERQRRNK